MRAPVTEHARKTTETPTNHNKLRGAGENIAYSRCLTYCPTACQTYCLLLQKSSGERPQRRRRHALSLPVVRSPRGEVLPLGLPPPCRGRGAQSFRRWSHHRVNICHHVHPTGATLVTLSLLQVLPEFAAKSCRRKKLPPKVATSRVSPGARLLRARSAPQRHAYQLQYQTPEIGGQWRWVSNLALQDGHSHNREDQLAGHRLTIIVHPVYCAVPLLVLRTVAAKSCLQKRCR